MSANIKIKTKELIYKEHKIAHIVISGVWGVGSVGNNNARILSNVFSSEIEDSKTLILDFLLLDYEFGDSIIDFANDNCRRGNDIKYAVLANKNLGNFLKILNSFNNSRFKFLGVFNTVDEALSNIEG